MSDETAPTQESPKKSNKTLFIVLGVVAVIALLGASIIGAFALGVFASSSPEAPAAVVKTSVPEVVAPPVVDSSPKLNPSDTLKALDAAARTKDKKEWDKYWDSTAVMKALIQPLRARIAKDKSWDLLVRLTGGESEATAALDKVMTVKVLGPSVGRSSWFKSGFTKGYTIRNVTAEGDKVTLTLVESNANKTTTLVMETRDVDGEPTLVVVAFDNESFNKGFLSSLAETLTFGL